MIHAPRRACQREFYGIHPKEKTKRKCAIELPCGFRISDFLPFLLFLVLLFDRLGATLPMILNVPASIFLLSAI